MGSWFEEIRSITARRLGGRSARPLGAFLSGSRDRLHTAGFLHFALLFRLGPYPVMVSVTFRVVFPLPLKLSGNTQQTRPRVCLLGDSKFSQIDKED